MTEGYKAINDRLIRVEMETEKNSATLTEIKSEVKEIQVRQTQLEIKIEAGFSELKAQQRTWTRVMSIAIAIATVMATLVALYVAIRPSQTTHSIPQQSIRKIDNP